MKPVERVKRVFQEPGVGRCLVQVFVNITYLESKSDAVVVNLPEFGHRSTHPALLVWFR
jgi:hypothetical protein